MKIFSAILFIISSVSYGLDLTYREARELFDNGQKPKIEEFQTASFVAGKAVNTYGKGYGSGMFVYPNNGEAKACESLDGSIFAFLNMDANVAKDEYKSFERSCVSTASTLDDQADVSYSRKGITYTIRKAMKDTTDVWITEAVCQSSCVMGRFGEVWGPGQTMFYSFVWTKKI